MRSGATSISERLMKMRGEAPEMHEELCHMSFILLIKQVAITEENHSPPIGRCTRNPEGRPLPRADGMGVWG